MTTLSTEPTSWLSLTHCKLPYWRIGQGPDLVFVHGWPLDARTWEPAVKELQKHFTCHLFNLPGARLTQWDEAFNTSLDAFGTIVTEAITAMGLDDKTIGLVAHDSGGTFARIAAQNCAANICGIALGNTEIPGYHPPMLKFGITALRPRASQAMLGGLLRFKVVQRLLFKDAVVDPALNRKMGEQYLQPLVGSPKALKGVMLLVNKLKIEDFDILKEVHTKLTMPVKLIWGADDPWFPLAQCRKMLSGFKGPVELVEIPNAKLLAHEEYPEHFAQEVHSHFTACFSN